AVHYALEQLFKKMSGGYLNSDESFGRFHKQYQFPAAASLISDFKEYMQGHRSIFTNEAFERRLQYGEEVLCNYYDHYIKSWNKVVSVERNMRGITINGVPIKGKPDKLEFNGKEVNIVDYKTGDIEKALSKLSPPNEFDPNGGDYWRQAVFYKILVDNYNKKGWQVISAEFDFIEPYKNKEYRKEKILIQPADITTVTRQLTEVWSMVQARQFYTGCGSHNCHWCNFVKDNKLAIAFH
ncbi:MAG: PD-(D/E)XK nuclease family protein, partial [Ferruginibacter sp.]